MRFKENWQDGEAKKHEQPDLVKKTSGNSFEQGLARRDCYHPLSLAQRGTAEIGNRMSLESE